MKNRRISQFLPLQILCFALLCLEGQSSVLAAAKIECDHQECESGKFHGGNRRRCWHKD